MERHMNMFHIANRIRYQCRACGEKVLTIQNYETSSGGEEDDDESAMVPVEAVYVKEEFDEE